MDSVQSIFFEQEIFLSRVRLVAYTILRLKCRVMQNVQLLKNNLENHIVQSIQPVSSNS